ncbi:MAG TPA: MFS transporter [Chthonomonadaceae bacterium]|nr:MFS transporter [Chthonomonadaceae bacterium]
MTVESADQSQTHPVTLDQKPLSIPQQLLLSSMWFATNLHWGALLLIIIPSQTGKIAPENKAAAQGFVLGIGAFMALIVPLVAGTLSDRSRSPWGRRRPFMAVGTAINLLGLMALFFAGNQHSLPLYLMGYLVVQLGNNIMGAAYNGVIPDQVPEAQRGEASGYMAMMTQAGTILGAVGSGFLLDQGKVLACYLGIGGVMAIFTLVSLVGIKEQPLQTEPEPLNWKQFFAGLLHPFRYSNFVWVWITRALVTMGMWSVQPFIQYYLTDVVHVDHAEKIAGLLLAVILAGATITGVIGGKISDYTGRKVVVYFANTIIAISSFALVFSHSILYTFVVGAIYGLGYGAYYSVDWALGCDALPNKEDAGKDMGIWHISMVLPQTFAPMIAGALLSVFPHQIVQEGGEKVVHYSVAGYKATFGAAALFLLLAAVLLRNVRESRERLPVQKRSEREG